MKIRDNNKPPSAFTVRPNALVEVAPSTFEQVDTPPCWEYQTVRMVPNADLAPYGRDGWELVTVVVPALDPGGRPHFYFKRRK